MAKTGSVDLKLGETNPNASSRITSIRIVFRATYFRPIFLNAQTLYRFAS